MVIKESFYLSDINGTPETSFSFLCKYKHMLKNGAPPDNLEVLFPLYAVKTCLLQMMVQRVLAAKDLSNAQGGCMFCGWIKVLPLFAMVMPGMISRVLYPGKCHRNNNRQCSNNRAQGQGDEIRTIDKIIRYLGLVEQTIGQCIFLTVFPKIKCYLVTLPCYTAGEN